jgi:tetratricopeptide (TPR) repeat protein
MICQRCGSLLEEDEILCPVCGTMVKRSPQPEEGGVRAFRQGRRGAVPPTLPDEQRSNVPEYGDFENSPLPVEQEQGVRRREDKSAKPMLEAFASRPSSHRGVPVHGNSHARQVVSKHGKAKAVPLHPINWMLIGVICASIVFAAGLGYFIYIKTSDVGQRITARKQVLSTDEELLKTAVDTDALQESQRKAALKTLSNAPAQAYWLVGGEYMDAGDMDDAIVAYRIADILDPENYDGLMQLGTAYELNNMDDKAVALYQNLITVVSPSRTDAYTALINLYLDNDRDPEAASTMLLAYQNTGKDSFRQQRKDFIPNTPQVDTKHLSGRYELAQQITVTSPQGYDIYYTLDDTAELPKQGKLVKDNTVEIPEGTYVLRAVCVEGDLVSDEMKVSYTVYYPSPPAPKCNLAPNTYSSLCKVNLRAGPDTQTKAERKLKTKDQLAKEDNQTFYYTIDGSTPDPALSPVYDGTPIALPSGDVTLRAIAVNGYGKQSSILEVVYKFKVKPYLNLIYKEDDTFTGFALNTTSISDFENQFGQPTNTTDTKYLNMDADAQQLDYAWGNAIFLLQSGDWTLARVEMNSAFTPGPRGVGIGNSESEITAAYKDVGMLKNQDGSRNLYYNDPKIGVVLNNSDGTRTVQYSCETSKGYEWVLQYVIKNDRCMKIINYYNP